MVSKLPILWKQPPTIAEGMDGGAQTERAGGRSRETGRVVSVYQLKLPEVVPSAASAAAGATTTGAQQFNHYGKPLTPCWAGKTPFPPREAYPVLHSVDVLGPVTSGGGGGGSSRGGGLDTSSRGGVGGLSSAGGSGVMSYGYDAGCDYGYATGELARSLYPAQDLQVC